MGMLRYERQGRIAPLPGATVVAPGGAEAYGAGLGQANKIKLYYDDAV